MKKALHISLALLIGMGISSTASADSTSAPTGADANQCVAAGPQAPRDIDSEKGENPTIFKDANKTEKMNLCNVHYHRNAEHKSEDYSIFVDTSYSTAPGEVVNGMGEHSGWACEEPLYGENDSERITPSTALPGDTVEVHWVYTSCDVDYAELNPHDGLGACMTATCANPQLRVVAQIFEVEEDGGYSDMSEPEDHSDKTVVYSGSTTGPGYSEEHCSPYQVTWDVKKTCGTINEHALHAWGNEELEIGGQIIERHEHAHGVRTLVTSKELLSKIKD